MITILIFGLVSSLLAALILGAVMLYLWSRKMKNQATEKKNARRREELRVWARHEITSRPEDEDTWRRNQEADMR